MTHLLKTFFVVALLSLEFASAAEPVRHLFLDPAFLSESHGVALRVNPAERREAVIRPDRPWEKLMISLFLTVLDETDAAGNKTLRMWYICRDADNVPNVAYAESTDGTTWTKPNLGIVDYHGSTENNLVGLSSLEGTVFRDPHARPGAEYVYITNLKQDGLFRFYSPDGLRWQRDAEPLFRFRPDTQNVTFWDERLEKYVLYTRSWIPHDDWTKRLRKVSRAELDDLTKPVELKPSGLAAKNPKNPAEPPRFTTELQTVLAPDEKDPPNSDVYNSSVQPYPLDTRWYVGFPSWFLRENSLINGRLETHFMGSRDGVKWERYDRAPYAPLGTAGSDAANMTFLCPNLVVRGDELWQYGPTFRTHHGDVAARKQQSDGTIHRWVQRVDGFVAAEFDSTTLKEGEARCTTTPVLVEGPQLRLNLDTGALGGLRVGLLDEASKPLPGFGLEDCRELHTNDVRAGVRWQDRADLESLVGKQVRLTFAGSRTKLFSFYFTADEAK